MYYVQRGAVVIVMLGAGDKQAKRLNSQGFEACCYYGGLNDKKIRVADLPTLIRQNNLKMKKTLSLI